MVRLHPARASDAAAMVGGQVIGIGGTRATGAGNAAPEQRPDITVNWREHRGRGGEQCCWTTAHVRVIVK